MEKDNEPDCQEPPPKKYYTDPKVGCSIDLIRPPFQKPAPVNDLSSLTSLPKEANPPIIRFVKLHPNAVEPTRAHPSDAGFDVTVIGVDKVVDEHVIICNTGIAIAPDDGYYTELVARSSLFKFGYQLANSVGIVDAHYRGEVKVILYKFDKSKPDITFPLRIAQLIPRRQMEIAFEEVDKLDDTSRGEGGLGSTGTTKLTSEK